MYITYHIKDRHHPKLERAAQRACNFWNHFVVPEHPLAITIALFKPWNPWSKTTGTSSIPVLSNGHMKSRVRLNKRRLGEWSEDQIAGTLAHEIGHSLGFGWAKWNALYDTKTGAFLPHAVAAVPALATMRVEMDDNTPQKFYHWDEGAFGDELMTPYKDTAPYVLPVTIEVMTLLGHTVRRQLNAATPLADLLALPPREATVNAAKADAETVKAAADFEAPDFEVLPM